MSGIFLYFFCKKKQLYVLYDLLNKFRTCFAKSTSELGVTDFIEFEINLSSRELIFYRPYRVSQKKEKEIIREKFNYRLIV